MKSARIMHLATLATIFALAFLGLGGSSAAAPQAPAAKIKPTRQIKVQPIQLRTAQDLKAAAAALRPATPAQPLRTKPLLTPLNAAAYREIKAQTAPGHGRQTLAAPQKAVPRTALTDTTAINFDGVDAATAGYIPPDTHGAAGRDYFVEVTNTHSRYLSEGRTQHSGPERLPRGLALGHPRLFRQPPDGLRPGL